MPGFDGTGPRGQGPLTGGGRGFCALPLGQVPPRPYYPYSPPAAPLGWPRPGVSPLGYARSGMSPFGYFGRPRFGGGGWGGGRGRGRGGGRW